MLNRLVILIFYLACVRFSTAGETQTEEMREELSLLIRRVNNLELEKGIEMMELREKIEDLREENKKLRTQTSLSIPILVQMKKYEYTCTKMENR